MKPRLTRRLGVLLAAAALGAACSSASAEPIPPVPAEADAADVQAVVTANTGLAIDLLQHAHREAPDTNLVLGPHSVSTAMTVVLGGARGNTADELVGALGHSLGAATLHETVAALDESLRARHGGKTQLSLANRVWLQDDLEVVSTFDALVSDVYDAGPELVDFRSEAPEAIEDVNDWGDDQTDGAIPEILDESAAHELLRWIVVNATYFKGDWADAFDADRTGDRPFTLGDGTLVETPTMIGDFEVSTLGGPTWRSARFPYRDGGLSMIVVMPEDLETFIAELDTETWTEVATGFPDPAAPHAELPKFSARWHGDLVPTFESLGVRDAFTCAADFSGIFEFDEPMDEGDTLIGFIQHEAFVEVNESGTEAAAVTAVGGLQKVSANLPDGDPFIVDRPFLFAITDDLTGAILFLGSIADPRLEAASNDPPPVELRRCG